MVVVVATNGCQYMKPTYKFNHLLAKCWNRVSAEAQDLVLLISVATLV